MIILLLSVAAAAAVAAAILVVAVAVVVVVVVAAVVVVVVVMFVYWNGVLRRLGQKYLARAGNSYRQKSLKLYTKKQYHACQEWRGVGTSAFFFKFVPYNLAGGLRSPSFLIGMWFCFVFCVGACLVLFVSLVVRGMSSTLESDVRPPSFRIGNIRHVV